MQWASSTAMSTGLRLASISGKPGTDRRSGAMNRKSSRPRQVVEAHLARRRPVAPGVDALRLEAQLAELRHLVLHQRDERRDDQRRAAPREARKLVAERLAGSGRHDQEDVLARHDRSADRLLIGAERGQAEGGMEEVGKVGGETRRRRSFLDRASRPLRGPHSPFPLSPSLPPDRRERGGFRKQIQSCLPPLPAVGGEAGREGPGR